MSVNKVILIGRVGKEPEVRVTTSGTVLANFSIATSEKFKDKEGNSQEKTEWHRILCFKRNAEIVRDYVHKGGLLYLEGKIQTRKWQNAEGVDQYTTEIIGNHLRMLGGNQNKVAHADQIPKANTAYNSPQPQTGQPPQWSAQPNPVQVQKQPQQSAPSSASAPETEFWDDEIPF